MQSTPEKKQGLAGLTLQCSSVSAVETAQALSKEKVKIPSWLSSSQNKQCKFRANLAISPDCKNPYGSFEFGRVLDKVYRQERHIKIFMTFWMGNLTTKQGKTLTVILQATLHFSEIFSVGTWDKRLCIPKAWTGMFVLAEIFSYAKGVRWWVKE